MLAKQALSDSGPSSILSYRPSVALKNLAFLKLMLGVDNFLRKPSILTAWDWMFCIFEMYGFGNSEAVLIEERDGSTHYMDPCTIALWDSRVIIKHVRQENYRGYGVQLREFLIKIRIFGRGSFRNMKQAVMHTLQVGYGVTWKSNTVYVNLF